MVDEYEESTAPSERSSTGSRPRTRTISTRSRRRRRCGAPGSDDLHSGTPPSDRARAQVPRAERCGFWRCSQRARPGAGGRARGRAPAGRGHRAGGDLRAGRRSRRAGRRRRGGDGGARDPLPPRRPGGALPAARGARRDRLAAGARRSRRLAGRGAGADQAAGRAALRRPGAADDDRPAAQGRHGLGLRGGAGKPPDPARGAGADPGLPASSTAKPRRRWRSAAPTSSCGA